MRGARLGPQTERVRGLLLACLLAASCAREVLTSEPIPGVAWTAVIESDESGEIVYASALVPYEGRAITFDKDPRATSIWSVGYPKEEIDAFGEPSADPLFAALGCDTALPKPLWSAHLLGATPEAEMPPSLSAPWLLKSCPPLEAIDLDVTCAPARCFAYTMQTGCAVQIDLDRCDLPSTTGRVRPDGTLCVDATERCKVTYDQHPSLECSGADLCTIEVLPASSIPNWQVDERRVVPGAVERVPVEVTAFGVHPIAMASGWFADVTVLEDRVVVASYEGRFQDNRSCSDPTPMLARMYSLNALNEIATSTLPPCATKLIADPNGDGFFALYGGTSWRVGRFARAGAQLESASIPLPVERKWDPFAVALIEHRSELWAVFSTWGEMGTAYALVVVDVASLGARVADVTEDATALDLVYGSALLMIPEVDSTRVRFYDPDFGMTVGYGQPGGPLGTIRLARAAFLQETGRLMIASPYDDPTFYLFDRSGVQQKSRAFLATRNVRPMFVSAFSFAPELALVGGVTSDEGQPIHTQLALYDPHVDRFLAGVYDAGFGAPTQVRTNGHAFFIGMAWDGRLLRIVPR